MKKKPIAENRILSTERVSVLIARPVNRPYDYLSNGFDLHIGDIVQVPFVNRLCIGVVVANGESQAVEQKLKLISNKYEGHGISVAMLVASGDCSSGVV